MPITIPKLQGRIHKAIDKLVEADRKNPKTSLTPTEIKGNPYVSPPGDNGIVDPDEMKGVADTFAHSVFEAAALRNGEKYLEGGTTGLKPKVMPAYQLSIAELRNFEGHIAKLVSGLETDGAGHITPQALENLSKTVQDYFLNTYPGQSFPPETLAKITEMVRTAATQRW